MNIYKWDIEERVEETFVALFKANVSESVMIRRARVPFQIAYPFVVVGVPSSTNANDQANFNGLRKMDVNVVMKTWAAKKTKFEDIEQDHRDLKSIIIGALAFASMHEQMNELNPQGIAFSSVHLMNVADTVEESCFVCTLTIEVIASPRKL